VVEDRVRIEPRSGGIFFRCYAAHNAFGTVSHGLQPWLRSNARYAAESVQKFRRALITNLRPAPACVIRPNATLVPLTPVAVPVPVLLMFRFGGAKFA
jgi:hypothetical protein